LRAARTQDQEGAWLTFQVIDTGRGMKPEELAKLFTAFYQADSSSTRKAEGTGLGLAITRRLCNLMGGEVGVSSEFGRGSTFTIRLPAILGMPERKPPLLPRSDGTPIASVNGQANLIVVIDDDPAVRDLMQRFLGKQGYEVQTAGSGEEGLRLVRQLRPSAVTLDAMMPGIDGWAVLASLKSDPETAAIPVIMATIVDDQSRGYALGATDYLTKPIDWDRLNQILSQYRVHQDGPPILVVEDNAETRELVVKMLRRNGWDVLEAENGRAGLRRLDDVKPSLILLDLMMPEVDGFQFVEVLRGREGAKEIPVVVITALDLSDEDRRRLNGSVLQILQKGAYTPAELLEEVRRQVERLTTARGS
jgi:CheY-like chemotaxis protein